STAGPSQDADLFAMVVDVLRETPLPPSLRGALLRVAARIPGVPHQLSRSRWSRPGRGGRVHGRRRRARPARTRPEHDPGPGPGEHRAPAALERREPAGHSTPRLGVLVGHLRTAITKTEPKLPVG